MLGRRPCIQLVLCCTHLLLSACQWESGIGASNASLSASRLEGSWIARQMRGTWTDSATGHSSSAERHYPSSKRPTLIVRPDGSLDLSVLPYLVGITPEVLRQLRHEGDQVDALLAHEWPVQISVEEASYQPTRSAITLKCRTKEEGLESKLCFDAHLGLDGKLRLDAELHGSDGSIRREKVEMERVRE